MAGEVTYEDLAAGTWPGDTLPARMSEADLAAHWGFSRRTLQRWRATGRGPVWMTLGGRILYRRSDIRAFEAAQLHVPDR